ncbi:MAG: ATP-binding protein, partial [Vicinamibacterales bacterium]
AHIGIPLVKQGELVAGLAVQFDQARSWTPDEIALAEDTAERTRAAVERARTEAALRDSDRRKDEFLAMLAHELRNPLAPIRNAAEILKAVGGSSAPELQARAVIERQIQHMSRLVDDLLDVSRITQGKVALRRAIVDLVQVVSNAVEATRPLIDARRQQLSVSTCRQPLPVNADVTRLEQVLVNLLHNASKFTPDGGQIWVEARDRAGQAVLTVRDDGVGLAQDLLPHVFDLFRQADRSLDRNRGGLGIGLTIVRSLVDLHEGTVRASSAGPGLGATFEIELPLASRPAATATPGAAPQLAASADQPMLRVLIVEDNDDAAEMLSALLRLNGYDTRTAANAGAALDLAGTFVPQVVLCDIGLPGVDGYELAARLRQLDGGRCRLVALTGYGQVEDRRRAQEAGFDHHLTKPVEPSALFALIEPR